MPGKLTYFANAGGYAEAIRAMLHHANFEFEDVGIPLQEFPAFRETGAAPMGSLPIWEEDDFTICTTGGILRVLAIRLGYYTEDPMIAYNIDSLVDFAGDLHLKFADYLMPVVLG